MENVQKVVARAAAEPEFRGRLLRDPGQALAGYDLSEAEVTALQSLKPEAFDSSTTDLEQRLSKSTGIIWGD